MRCVKMTSPREGMWDRWAYERAVRESDLNKVEKAVANNLSAHAKGGVAWPKATTIATETGWSERWVRKARQSLEEKGWLAREPNSSRCVLTQPVVAAPQPEPTTGQSVASAGSTAETQPVASAPQPAVAAPQPVASAPTNRPKNKPKNSPREEGEWLAAEFERRDVRVPVGANPPELIALDLARMLPFVVDFRDWVTARLSSYGARSGARQRWPSWLVDDAARGRGVPDTKPRNALRRPDDTYGQDLLEEIKANAVDQDGNPIDLRGKS